MLTYIKSMTLRGIKNIDKNITLEFYNKTLLKEANLSKTNIKAIYGPNGSGKTAIIQAMNIYQQLTSTRGYLYSNENQNYLREIINKKTNEFELSLDFFIYDKNTHETKGNFLHNFILSLENNEFYIKKEVLEKQLSRSSETIFKSEEGKLISSNLTEEINDYSKHQIKKRSIVDLGSEHILENLKSKDFDLKKCFELLSFNYLANSLYINTREIDSHSFFTHNIARTNKILKLNKNIIIRDSLHTLRVHKDIYDDYLKESKGLESFLKIFKKDLIKLDYNVKYDKDFYVLEPIMIYKDCKIHLEFESAGVKKLFELYMPLKALEAGSIVFIDEFDANINDVYLMRLLDYFNESNIGQLVFTTHNISPMEVLDKNKHSIDFITDELQVVKRIKNGNYSPVNIYRSGLIKGLPFNIYPFDFLGVFNDYEE